MFSRSMNAASRATLARCEEVEHGHGLGFGPKLAGRLVADEAELVNGLEHPLAGRGSYPFGPVQDVGDGTH